MTHWQPTAYDRLQEATAAQADEYRALASEESQAAYENITRGLPVHAMYGLGPHSVPIVRDVLEVANPRHVLEIGFGAGVSSTMMLVFSVHIDRLVSIDYTTDHEVLQAAAAMEERWGRRFHLMAHDSRTVRFGDVIEALGYAVPDLMFIDGGHDEDTVVADLGLAQALRPTWLLLDDWWPLYGPGVQAAWAQRGAGYNLHTQWGNVILFRRAPEG